MTPVANWNANFWIKPPGEEYIPASAPNPDGLWTIIREPLNKAPETGEKWVFVD
jgi:hypothetical protein